MDWWSQPFMQITERNIVTRKKAANGFFDSFCGTAENCRKLPISPGKSRGAYASNDNIVDQNMPAGVHSIFPITGTFRDRFKRVVPDEDSKAASAGITERPRLHIAGSNPRPTPGTNRKEIRRLF